MEQKIEKLEKKVVDCNLILLERDFSIDELRVESIKLDRLNVQLKGENEALSENNQELTESAELMGKEISLLQKKVKDLMDANKDVTGNYQIVKKNFELKKKEADELSLELDEAKNACQLALKQKKGFLQEIESLRTTKADLENALFLAKDIILKKETEMDEYTRNASIKAAEAEEELLLKNQQISSMTTHMAEGTLFLIIETLKLEQQRAAASAANRKKEEAAALRSTVDETLITGNEKKWQKKENAFIAKLEEAQQKLKDKQSLISGFVSRIKELEQDLYNPRMASLEALEIELKNKLIELSIWEEKLVVIYFLTRLDSFAHWTYNVAKNQPLWCLAGIHFAKIV
jgi:chromosome segregation ATPase